MKKVAAKLDWTRMLGFEQMADVRETARDELLAPKVGVKTGVKLGTKIGVKIGVKAGIKA